jgi:hypothetical protein
MAPVAGGPVRPHVQAFADEINRRFGFTHIMTYAGHQPTRDRALDCFGPQPNPQAKMLELAWWCTRDDVINHFGIDYVIFNADPATVGGEIWNRELKRAWRQMPNRGGVTQNHHDHDHISFEETGSASPFGGPPSPIPIITDLPAPNRNQQETETMIVEPGKPVAIPTKGAKTLWVGAETHGADPIDALIRVGRAVDDWRPAFGKDPSGRAGVSSGVFGSPLQPTDTFASVTNEDKEGRVLVVDLEF